MRVRISLCTRQPKVYAIFTATWRHAGIGLLTPEIVHDGQVAPVLDHRRAVLASAYAAHPEQRAWSRRAPRRDSKCDKSVSHNR